MSTTSRVALARRPWACARSLKPGMLAATERLPVREITINRTALDLPGIGVARAQRVPSPVQTANAVCFHVLRMPGPRW